MAFGFRERIVAREGGERVSFLSGLFGSRDPYALLRKRNVGGLIKLLDSDQAPTAASVLGQLKDTRAVTPLASLLLATQDHETAKAAARSLGEIGGPEAVKALVEFLGQSPREDPRLAAVAALSPIADAQAANALLECLGSGNVAIRGWAVKGLERVVEPRAVAPLLAMLRDASNEPILSDIEKALTAQGEPAVDGLREAMNDENHDVMFRASQALYLIPGEKAFQTLVGALAHEKSDVVANAAMYLGWRKDDRAVNALAAMLRREGLNFGAANECEKALLSFGPAAGRAVLDLLADGPESVRRSMARALSKSERAGKEVAAALGRAAANDPSQSVREAARDALQKFSTDPELIAAALMASGDTSETMDFATFRACVDRLSGRPRMLCLIVAAEALMKAGRNLPALQCYSELVAVEPLEGIENVGWNWINGAWHETARRVSRPGWVRITSDDPAVAAAFHAAAVYPHQKTPSDTAKAAANTIAALRGFLGRPGERASSLLHLENAG